MRDLPGIIERARPSEKSGPAEERVPSSRKDALRLIRHIVSEAAEGRRMDPRVEADYLVPALVEHLSGVPLETCLGLRRRGRGRPRGRSEHSEDEKAEILERMNCPSVIEKAKSTAKRGEGSFAARVRVAAEQVSGNKPNSETVQKWHLEKIKADREAADIRSGKKFGN